MTEGRIPAVIAHALPLTVRGRGARPRLAHAIVLLDVPLRRQSFPVRPLSLPNGRRALSGDGRLWVCEADRGSHSSSKAILDDLRRGALRMGNPSQIQLEAFGALVTTSSPASADPASVARVAKAVSARLSEDLILGDGTFLRRARHPLVHFDGFPNLRDGVRMWDPYWPAPVLAERVSPDGLAPHFAPGGWLSGHAPGLIRECADTVLRILGELPHGNDDVIRFANTAPQLLVLLHRAYGVAGSRDHEEALWPFIELGSVDAVRGEDVASSVEACMAAALPLLDRIPPRSPRADLPRSIALFVERIARPALDPNAPAEDAEHLGTLCR